MVFERAEDVSLCDVKINVVSLEQVNEFVYLGSMFTRNGKIDADVERRMNAGNNENGAIHAVVSGNVGRGRPRKTSGKCVISTFRFVSDSESQYHRILKEICAKHGKKYTKDLERRNTGSTDKEVCATVVEELHLNVTAEELERELQDLSKRKLPQAPLQIGVERLLKHLYNAGILFALVTNSTRRAVRLHVAAKPQIFGLFHHMVCANDPNVDRGKPYPDIYLMAAAKFPDKPKPIKCLVFEDSIVGLEAAVAAGMQVVMTPPRRLPPQYIKKATLVLKSLQDFKPEYFGLPPFSDGVKKRSTK